MRNALAIIGVALLLAGCGSGSTGDGDPGDAGDNAQGVASGPPPEQRCLELWNGDENQFRFMTSSIMQGATRYVSVGFAADYPDLCLITASNTQHAMQFMESQSKNYGTWETDGNPSPAASLPESTKDWNAAMDDRGYLTLY